MRQGFFDQAVFLGAVDAQVQAVTEANRSDGGECARDLKS